MLEQLKTKIKEAMQGIEFSASTKYICISKVSLSQIKMYNENSVPSFLKGSQPKQYLYLMPEISLKLSEREKIKDSANKLKEALGDEFEVGFCPTKNDIIFQEGFYVSVCDI